MTENYQHRKPPTFDEDDTAKPAESPGTDPTVTNATPPAASTESTPTAPAAPAIVVQQGRVKGEPIPYVPPAAKEANTTEATSTETSTPPPSPPGPTPATGTLPRVVVVPGKTASPKPMASETAVPAAERQGVWSTPSTTKVTPVTWLILAVVSLIALGLRLREPLSSPVMGAEDPYLHLQRTWNLVQGSFPRDYPVGFMILLAPFTLLGPDAFYQVARFLPTFAGPAMCIGMFLFCRNYMLPSGALVASFLVAVMPEMILRTNILFPTAVDLAVVPFLFLAFFRLIEGHRWAMYTTVGLTLGLLLVHPWFVALMLPPMAAFGLIVLVTHNERRTWATSGSIAGALGVVGLVWLFRQFQPATLLAGFSSKFFEVMGNPAMIVNEPPVHVDLPWMITLPAILLGIVGGVYAVIHRSRIGLLALLWTLMLLPLTLVDWFGVWYIPHRTVAYMAVGVALLGGIAVSEIVFKFTKTNVNLRVPATLGVLGLLALLTIPTAASVDPWYRIYDEDDFAAWDTLEGLDADFVMCGSWQARAGYRSLTANEADFMPQFFDDENQRAVTLGTHPGLYVLIDQYTITDGRDVSFLENSDEWELITEQNDVKVYKHNS